MADTAVYQAPNNSFFIDLLEHEKFLERYEHNLRGEVEEMKLIEGTNQYTMVWTKKHPAKMNDDGITSVISFLRTVCEKIISITNFDEEMMGKMIYQNIQDYTDRLCENFYTYEFKSIADLSEINLVGNNLIISQLSRSKDGMTLKAVTSNTMISENKVINTPQQIDPNGVVQRPGAGGLLNKIGIKI
jgi:hypothetical protein